MIAAGTAIGAGGDAADRVAAVAILGHATAPRFASSGVVGAAHEGKRMLVPIEEPVQMVPRTRRPALHRADAATSHARGFGVGKSVGAN